MENMIVKMEVMRKDVSARFSIPKKVNFEILQRSICLPLNSIPKACMPLSKEKLNLLQKIKEVLDLNLISS